MNDVDIARLRELLQKAPPLPWKDTVEAEVVDAEGFEVADVLFCKGHSNPGELIVAAINALPELLEAYERLQSVCHVAHFEHCPNGATEMRLERGGKQAAVFFYASGESMVAVGEALKRECWESARPHEALLALGAFLDLDNQNQRRSCPWE